MASSKDKDALRRQRRRELDARRSKSRVRLGACLPRWGQLKESLGFTLHSELAQYLLESYFSKVAPECSVSRDDSAIMASAEALERLVLLVHCHGQWCPHPPALQLQSPLGGAGCGSDPSPGQRRRQGRVKRPPESGTRASGGAENGSFSSSSTGAGLLGSPEALDGELCLSYVCESGHAFSWSPDTQTGLGSEGEGGGAGAGAGVPLTITDPPRKQGQKRGSRETQTGLGSEGEGGGEGAGAGAGAGARVPLTITDPPRKQGQKRGSRAVREGVRVAKRRSILRTRSRSGVQRTEASTETESPAAQRAAGGQEEEGEEEEEEVEEVASAPTAGTESTQEHSGQVETDTGSVAVTTGFPQPSQSWTSVSNDEVPVTVSKKKRKADLKDILQCTYEGCEKIFSNRQYLNYHIKYQHIQQKTFSCSHPSCGKSFNFKKHLKEHEKLHSNQRDYICEFCARAFRTSSNLVTHRRIHTGEKPLQCEVCGFTCSQKASLNWHMKKHNAESSYQFPCDICGRRFEKRDNVTAHRSKSHPEHPATANVNANANATASNVPPDPVASNDLSVTSNDLSAAPSVAVSE